MVLPGRGDDAGRAPPSPSQSLAQRNRDAGIALCPHRGRESGLLSRGAARRAQRVSAAAGAAAACSPVGDPPPGERRGSGRPPAVWGVGDSYGSALLHPRRAGRRAPPIGRTGQSPHRGIGGGTLCWRLHPLGLVVAWDGAGAPAPDSAFPPLSATVAEAMSGLSATAFPATAGAPPHLQLRARRTANTRRLVETGLSMLTGVGHVKKVWPRPGAACPARLAFTLAPVTLLVPWQGLKPAAQGLIRLSLAAFSLSRN